MLALVPVAMFATMAWALRSDEVPGPVEWLAIWGWLPAAAALAVAFARTPRVLPLLWLGCTCTVVHLAVATILLVLSLSFAHSFVEEVVRWSAACTVLQGVCFGVEWMTLGGLRLDPLMLLPVQGG